MSLKTIKNDYAELLKVFESCGVKLTKKQKSSMDAFVSNYAKTLNESKKQGVIEGIKIAEKKIKPVIESILKHQTLNQKLVTAIQEKVATINESKRIAVKVDKYLSEALEEALPKEKAIDYAKLDKYQTIVESLKDVLTVNDATFKQKADDFTSAYQTQVTKYFKENAELKRELQKKDAIVESTKKEAELAKGKALLESKAASLPAFEAKKVKEQLKNLTEAEVEKRFDEAVSAAAEEAADAAADDDTLEEDVNALIEAEMSNSDSDKDELGESDNPDEEDDADGEEDPKQTFGEAINESVIYSDQVQHWMSLANRITPIG